MKNTNTMVCQIMPILYDTNAISAKTDCASVYANDTFQCGIFNSLDRY